jgi:hypothetical protein
MGEPALRGQPFRREPSDSRAGEVPGIIPVRERRSEPSVFRIFAYCYTAVGELTVANLGSWPCQAYAASVERLLADDRFLTAIESRLSSKGFAASTCESVYVGLRNGKPSRVFPQVFPADASARVPGAASSQDVAAPSDVLARIAAEIGDG